MKILQRVHPFLIGVFAILYPAAKNFAQVEARSVALSAGVVLAAIGLVWLGVRAVIKDSVRSALVTSVLVVVFFNFGHLFDLLWGTGIFPSMRTLELQLAVVLVLIVGWAILRLVRAENDLQQLASFAGLFGVLLLVSAAYNVFTASRTVRSADDAETAEMELFVVEETFGSAEPILEERADRPDVYFFIFDGYAGAETLRRVYGFDNSPFLDGLTRRGFHVADPSWSNYSMTLLSLAATLNMRQVDDMAAELVARGGARVNEREPFWKLIRSPEVARFLKSKGYRYVTFATNWSGTSTSEVADRLYDFVPFYGPFEDSVLRTTALRSLAPSVADAHRFTLDKVREIPRIEGPTFAFVHVLLPHNPYVFDRHGNERANIPMRMHWQVRTGGWREQQAYIDQMIYLNGRIEALVDEILEGSSIAPIIYLQGDHGSASTAHRAGGSQTPLPSERLSILNASLVPEDLRRRLYPGMTPVNTFRLLLSTLFDADYPLLEDRLFFSWYGAPFLLEDVTEEIAARSVSP